MKISKSIHYVGVNDHQIDLFEGLFNVPNGMSYNSYVIFDEKIAVMDSVGENFGEEWLDNIESAVGNRTPDYLIVQHMEMDHSANIQKFISKYPNAKIVASKMAFGMLNSLFGDSLGKISEKQIVVSDGESLELGEHILHFVSAPNVHWPEVIFTYESSEKILFSADAFGKFGALDYEDPEGWACEARRYYFGIVGKFGTSVQAVLKKLEGLQIEKICSLHGPVLDSDIESYLQKYQIWSSYAVESEGVFIAYTSVYGNTKKAVEKLAEILKEKGDGNVKRRTFTFTELKRMDPQATLDLHGETQKDSEVKVREFLSSSLSNGLRKISIITGKGLHSEDGQGVLREVAEGVLRESDAVSDVSNAPLSKGGSGALWVVLKEKKD